MGPGLELESSASLASDFFGCIQVYRLASCCPIERRALGVLIRSFEWGGVERGSGMAGVWGLAWLGQLEGRGTEECWGGGGAEGKHCPLPSFALGGL